MKTTIAALLVLACLPSAYAPTFSLWTYDRLNEASNYIFIARLLGSALLEVDTEPDNRHDIVDRYKFTFTVETVLKGSVKNSELSYSGLVHTPRPDGPEILLIVGNIKKPPDLRGEKGTYFIVFAKSINDGIISLTTNSDPALSFIKIKGHRHILSNEKYDEIRKSFREHLIEQGVEKQCD